MTCFLDLPKRLRERIYRESLIRHGQTTLADFLDDCGGPQTNDSAPALLKVNAKIAVEAASFYFSCNRFRLESIHELRRFLDGMRRCHTSLISYLTVVYESSPSYVRTTLKRLLSMRNARNIRIIVDERAIAAEKLLEGEIIQWHSSLGVSDQLKLRALMSTGTRCLSALSKQPGFGSAVIKPYILGENEYHRKSTFGFFNLPTELRTSIYGEALIFPGKLYVQSYSTTKPPTSVAASLKYYHRPSSAEFANASASAPPSALELLAVNRQIHAEASGIFYRHNDFVFSSPATLAGFLASLTLPRLTHLREITLFRHMRKERYTVPFDHVVLSVKLLPNLRKLHVLFPADYSWEPSLHELGSMFTLRRLRSICVRDLRLEDELQATAGVKFRKRPIDLGRRQALLEEQHALRHFNRGLCLAQKGIVVASLYQDENWAAKSMFPALEGSTCSAVRGCTCEEVDREIVEESES